MRLAKRRKVRPDDPVAVVTRFLDAANHHDGDGLRACVHPEFESFQPLHPARNFRGAGQLISNWKAIFEAEPGFRLTLLRASTTGNTVWAEIHGAGASAEAAGIFIVGVEDSRIRWIRVYSDLVEPLPEEPAEDAPAPATSAVDWDRDPIRLVPPRDSGDAEAAEDEQAEEEPGGGEEPEVAAVTAEAPALRLVGADTIDEELATGPPAEGEAIAGAPTPGDTPEGLEAAEVAEATGGESIEVLVGEAPEVEAREVEPESTDEPADVEARADAIAEDAIPEDAIAEDAIPEDAIAEDDVAEVGEEAAPAPPAAAAEEGADEKPDGALWDTVASLGGAGPDPSGSEGQPSRRRLGFLRRGGRTGSS